jgi:hypothetical protein
MSQLTINLGTTANDGTGDPLRTAFTKINANFTDLYTQISGLELDAVIPSQTGNNGLYLTTNGSALSWSSTPAITSLLPSQTGNAGNFLTTNGSGNLSWGSITASTILPPQSGNSGKYLTTDGAGNLSWATVSSSSSSITNNSHTLSIDTYGQLNLPISQYSDTVLNGGTGLPVILQTFTSGGSPNSFTFNADGRFIIPAALQFSDGSQQTVAYTGPGGVKYVGILDAYSNNFTVTTQQLVLVYPNSSARTITLPASPVSGQTVTIKKVSGFSSSPWNVIVSGGSNNIDASSSVTISSGWGYVTVVFGASTNFSSGQWWITSASL